MEWLDPFSFEDVHPDFTNVLSRMRTFRTQEGGNCKARLYNDPSRT